MGGGRRACSKAGGEGSRGDRCVPEEALSASITSNDWIYHQLNPRRLSPWLLLRGSLLLKARFNASIILSKEQL